MGFKLSPGPRKGNLPQASNKRRSLQIQRTEGFRLESPATAPSSSSAPPAPSHAPAAPPPPRVLDLPGLLLGCVVDEELVEVEVIRKDVAADVVASDGQAVVCCWVLALGGHLGDGMDGNTDKQKRERDRLGGANTGWGD